MTKGFGHCITDPNSYLGTPAITECAVASNCIHRSWFTDRVQGWAVAVRGQRHFRHHRRYLGYPPSSGFPVHSSAVHTSATGPLSVHARTQPPK